MNTRLLVVGCALALAACSTLQRRTAREHAYSELVQLRGETLTLLEEHRLGVGEAQWLESTFNQARTDLDAGDLRGARVLLSGAYTYLNGRSGAWTR